MHVESNRDHHSAVNGWALGMSLSRTNVLCPDIGIPAVRHAELALTMHKSGTLMRG